jgi:hypothetical protein
MCVHMSQTAELASSTCIFSNGPSSMVIEPHSSNELGGGESHRGESSRDIFLTQRVSEPDTPQDGNTAHDTHGAGGGFTHRKRSTAPVGGLVG